MSDVSHERSSSSGSGASVLTLTLWLRQILFAVAELSWPGQANCLEGALAASEETYLFSLFSFIIILTQEMPLSLLYADCCQSQGTGFDEVFSEKHRFLPGAHLCSVNIFEKSGLEGVASTRECSKSVDLHYGERKQHHRVCSFHPSNGTSPLPPPVSLCLLG